MHQALAETYYRLKACGRKRHHNVHTHALGSYLCSGVPESLETSAALEMQAKLRQQTTETGAVYYHHLTNSQP